MSNLMSEFNEYLAVATLAQRNLTHARSSNAFLPADVERWQRVGREALLEAARVLAAGSRQGAAS